MRISNSILLAGTALTLVACGTTPDRNPYYSQTTTQNAPVQQARAVQQNTRQTGVRQVVYETQGAAPIRYSNQTSQPSVHTAGYQNQADIYRADSSTVTYTRVDQECLNKEGNRKIIGAVAGGAIGALAGNKLGGDNKTLGTIGGAALGGAAGYGVADKSITCDPIVEYAPAQTAVVTPAYQPLPSAPVYRSHTTRPAAPIQENTESLGAEGTPGYYAVNGLEQPANAPQSVSLSQPQYANVVTPIEMTVTPPQAAPLAGTQQYLLQPGDTVYSLARKNCISVADFKQMNNIDDNFYIRAGDPIMIPAGRCPQ